MFVLVVHAHVQRHHLVVLQVAEDAGLQVALEKVQFLVVDLMGGQEVAVEGVQLHG